MLDITGLTLHRAGTGPNLLLLHCLGVDHLMWSLAAPGLTADFTVLSCDVPGHGDAPAAGGPYGIEDISEQVAALLEREGVARTHVAGISLGGLVAQHLAATRPDLVDRLVLIDTTARYTDERRANWAERAAAARGTGVASMTEGLLGIWFTPEAVAANLPSVDYVRACFARCDGEAYALACEALATADLRELAPTITAPTLVVCGEQDIPSFIDAAHWLHQAIPDARLVWLRPAKHASVLEQPEQFEQALVPFLSAAA